MRSATGEPFAPRPHPKYVHSLAFLPDGQRLVTGSFGDEQLWIWGLATARVLRKIPGPGRNFRFLTVSPDGRRVAAWADGPKLRICDLRSGEKLLEAAGRPLAYSPDGRWLAVVWAGQADYGVNHQMLLPFWIASVKDQKESTIDRIFPEKK